MKKLFTLVLLCFSILSFSQSTTLVISQVYGAGGNSGATLNADFVELHNVSTTAKSTAGLSIQYGSATTTNWSASFNLPTASVPAGGYYLIRMSTVGTNGTAFTFDATPTAGNEIAMGATAGRVALVNGTTILPTGCPAASAVVDLVGYGTTCICFEGTGPAAAPSTTDATYRKLNGCTETNDNASDFIAAPVAPRSSTSPVSICGTTSASLSANTLTSFGNGCTNTTTTPNSFTITGTALTNAPVTVAALAGYTYSTTVGGTYTSTLSLTQAGGAYSQQIFVKFTPTAVQSYNGNIVVSGGGASAINIAASGAGINTIATVTVGAATGITATSATVPGTITATGCSAITDYGIEYSTTNNFANGTGTAVSSTNLAAGGFSSLLTGLAGNTTYYVHSYATNAGGTAYSTQMMFTTLVPVTPVLSGNSLSSFGATCVNTVSSTNSFTITGTNLTNADISVAALAGFTYSTTAAGTYTTTLTLTQPGGAYSQQIFVKFSPTAVQSYNGNIVISGAGAPSINVAAIGSGVNSIASVTTGTATAITNTGATLAGNISSIGCSAVTVYGVEYSLINGFANGTGIAATSSNIAAGNYSANVTGLSLGTVYYYHSYATNAGGTAYGLQQSFTTLGGTLAATALSGFGTICTGSIAGPNSFTISSPLLSTSNVNIAALAGFTYSTTATGTYTPTLSITQPGGAFSQIIYVKFSPTSIANFDGNIVVSGGGAVGINVPVTGSGINTAPSITTDSDTNILKNSATLAGIIGAASCNTLTSYGIEYSSIAGFTNGFGKRIAATNNVSGKYKVDISGLVQNTKYYYKAYIVSAAGITYGIEKTFTTAAINSGLIIYSNPVARGGYLYFSIDNVVPANYTVSIINALGQRVSVVPDISPLNFIDDKIYLPSYLAIGVYTLELRNTNNDKVETKKFIIR